ncbi:DNA-3-methyladenine glycosylase 1 [compost metagenome]
MQKESGTFDRYLWAFVGGRPVQHNLSASAQIPVRTPAADALSADLRLRGFKFVGPTICYAFMQAAGLVNDHTVECFRWQELARA